MAAEVDARIRDAVERCDGGIDGKIVRLVVRDIPRHIVRELDHRTLREYKRRALHFQLDTRRPDVIRLHGPAAPGRRPSLADIVRDKLQGRLLEGDIDRSALVDLGLRYLAEAEAVSAASPAPPDGAGGRRVRLNSLHLQNFRQHADSRIEFDTGLTGDHRPERVGQDDDSRGRSRGRSTGTVRRAARGSRCDSIGRRRGRRCAWSWTSSSPGTGIASCAGSRTPSCTSTARRVPIANSITGVTELLQRRLGMTRAEFFNTYFTGQKELNVMAAMGPSERAKFLSRVLGYEKLRTAQDLVRERRRLITAEIGRAAQRHAGPRHGGADPHRRRGRGSSEADRRLAVAERRERESAAGLAAATPPWVRVQEERDRLQELLTDLKLAERDEESLVRDGERIARELTDVEAARDGAGSLASRAGGVSRGGGRAAAGRRVVPRGRPPPDAARQCPRVGRGARSPARAPRQAGDRARTRGGSDHRAGDAAAGAEEAQGQLEARRTEWVRDRQEAETKLQALRSQYADVRQQRERLVAAGEEGQCPTCARPLGGHYRTVLDLLDEQAETVRVDGNYFKARLEQLEQMPPEVRQLDEQRRALTQEVGGLERKLAKVQLAVQELLQVGRDTTAKEQRADVLLRDIAAIPGGYDAAHHAHLKSEAERLTPLDATSGAARRAGGARAAAGARAVAGRGLGGVRYSRASKEMRARRDGINFSEATYHAVREQYERAAAQARGGEIAAVTARSEAASAREARSRPPSADARSWTSCRSSSTCCIGTSGCTTSWTGRSRICGRISTSRSVPKCRSWPADFWPTSPTAATASWSWTTSTTSSCSKRACPSP